MRHNGSFKTYHQLQELEIEKLYAFCCRFQPSGFYDTIEPMKKYLGGSLMQQGEHHLSCWKEGEPVVAVGWIDREVVAKKELYLTHGFSSEEGLKSWPSLLNQIKTTVDASDLRIKLGIRGECNALEPWAIEQKWQYLYSMLKMSKHLERQAEVESDLKLVALTESTWETFMSIHNGGFEQVPNGGLLEASERDELMASYLKERGRLLLGYDGNRAVAIAMLKIDANERKADLEALAVAPQDHGQGYGRKMLRSLCCLLGKDEPMVDNLELMVMDANERAYHLYLSEEFKVDRVEVKWYAKDPQAK